MLVTSLGNQVASFLTTMKLTLDIVLGHPYRWGDVLRGLTVVEPAASEKPEIPEIAEIALGAVFSFVAPLAIAGIVEILLTG